MSGPWHVVWQTEKQNKVVAAPHAWICTDTFHLAPEWKSDICHPKVFGQKSPYPTVEHKPQLSPIKFAISHSTCKMFILYSMSTWIPEVSISKSAYNYIVLCWLCCVLFKFDIHPRIAYPAILPSSSYHQKTVLLVDIGLHWAAETLQGDAWNTPDPWSACHPAPAVHARPTVRPASKPAQPGRKTKGLCWQWIWTGF